MSTEFLHPTTAHIRFNMIANFSYPPFVCFALLTFLVFC